MVKTFSAMFPLGQKAPNFRLLDTVSQTEKSLGELKSDTATVIMFICNHCPFVIHVRDELLHIVSDYQHKKVSFIAISANDPTSHPDDAPDKMHTLSQALNFNFPYLFDNTQTVAKAYQAACTPDFYVFNGDMACVYRGRMDGATPGNDIPVTGEDLRAALDHLLAGTPIDPDQKPSMGCNIKWREA